jgi:glutathione S-transferase
MRNNVLPGEQQAECCLQMPNLHHGSNVVADSTCIYKYLCATYPDKMKVFTQKTPQQCASMGFLQDTTLLR